MILWLRESHPTNNGVLGFSEKKIGGGRTDADRKIPPKCPFQSAHVAVVDPSTLMQTSLSVSSEPLPRGQLLCPIFNWAAAAAAPLTDGDILNTRMCFFLSLSKLI